MSLNILDYGADPSGKTLSSPAIQRSLDDCAKAGGGTVVCPPGNFLTGTILIGSDTEFRIEKGCVLTRSVDPGDFHMPPGATGVIEQCSILASVHTRNVKIEGEGEIDGMCRTFMREDPDNGGNGEEHLSFDSNAFRPKALCFEDVEGLRIAGLTFRDSASWTLHLAGCRNTVIENIKILNHLRAANTDAIDPDSCQNMLIRNCHIQTGDDGICLKTTKGVTEIYGSCENITVTDCIIDSTSAGLKIGTETFGDVRNVVFENCVVRGCSHVMAVYARDGGTVENVVFRKICGDGRCFKNAPRHIRDFAWWGKGDAIFVSNSYRNERKLPPGRIRNIAFEDISVTCEASSYIAGGVCEPIEGVSLDKVSLRFARQGCMPTGFFDETPSVKNAFKHTSPALYARGVSGLTVRSLSVEWVHPETEAWTELAEIEDSNSVMFSDISASPAKSTLPLLRIACSHVLLTSIHASKCVRVFEEVDSLVVKLPADDRT